MRNSIRVRLQIRCILIGLLAAAPVMAQVDVLTERYDNTRSGLNPNETILNKSNVKIGKFGKLAFRIVDGNIYAQPLTVTQAKIANHPGPVNVVIVATEHNSVYAFDGDDTAPETGGQESAKALWHTGPDVLGEHIESDELAVKIGAQNCQDLTTEVGITSTPYIVLTKKDSPKEGVIFVAAKSKSGNTFVYKMFALSLADGKPLGNSQGVAIQGQVPTVGGTISFDPVVQLNRPALLVDNNTLYIAFGGHCDTNEYHGWIFAYDVSNPAAPQKVDAFSSTLVNRGTGQNGNEGRGGIWMSGQGPLADGNGAFYFVTGDGTYDVANDNFRNLGNSVVKAKLVSGKIQVQDWYAPQNRDDLRKLDADLGSGGPVLVPNSHLLLAGGKEGRIYLIDQNDMGRGVKLSLHSFQVTNPPLPRVAHPAQSGDTLYWNIHGAPVVWPLQNQMFVYVMGEEDHLKQYKLVPDGGPTNWKFASDTPFKTSKESAPLPNPPNGLPNDKTRNTTWMPGGFITVSSNGGDAKSGIVWVTMPFSNNANREVVLGVLRAFDASDVSKGQLWSSEDSGVPADRLGMFAKFNPPTIANGKVYVATFQQERMDNGAHRKMEGGDQPALVIYGPK
jgi:hypothetical protein